MRKVHVHYNKYVTLPGAGDNYLSQKRSKHPAGVVIAGAGICDTTLHGINNQNSRQVKNFPDIGVFFMRIIKKSDPVWFRGLHSTYALQ